MIPLEQIHCTVFIVILQKIINRQRPREKKCCLRLSMNNWTLNATACAYKCCRWVLVQSGLFSFLIYWHGEIKMLPHVSNSVTLSASFAQLRDLYTQAECKRWWTHMSRRLLALLFSRRPEKKKTWSPSRPIVWNCNTSKMRSTFVTTMLQSWRFCYLLRFRQFEIDNSLDINLSVSFFFFNMGKKQTGQSDVYTAQRTARKLFFQLSCASQKFSGGSGGHVWWIHFLHWQPYVILLCASTPGATNRGNEEKIIKHTLVLTGPLQHYLQRNENIFKLWNTASQMFPPQKKKKECRPCIYNLTIHL